MHAQSGTSFVVVEWAFQRMQLINVLEQECFSQGSMFCIKYAILIVQCLTQRATVVVMFKKGVERVNAKEEQCLYKMKIFLLTLIWRDP